MASTEIEIPASDIIVPGSHNIDPYSFPQISDPVSVDAAEVVHTWASRFNAAAQSGESEVSGLFLKSSYWRDLLCMTWDFHTWHGSANITSLLKNQGKGWRIKSVQVDGSNDLRKPSVSPFDVGGKVKGVQSFLTVETDVGKGRGIVQLLPDDEDEGKWKVFTLLTTLEELTGFEEPIYERRPLGALHGAQLERKTWKERRCAEQEYEGKEPTVLIIGIGISIGGKEGS
jgi:hypothetical protein